MSETQALPSYQNSKPGDAPAVVQTGAAAPQYVVQLNQPSPQPVFKDFPVVITDSRGQQVETVLDYRIGVLTWLAFGAICLAAAGVGLCFLAFIIFCVKGLKDVYHINPNDGRVVAVYKRI